MKDFLKTNYNFEPCENYLHFVKVFSELDKNLKVYHKHHVCPRCCGGNDNPKNLVKISPKHHKKLHQLILLSKCLTDEQRDKLKFAYSKMKGN